MSCSCTFVMSSVTMWSPLWRMTPNNRTRFLCWSFLNKVNPHETKSGPPAENKCWQVTEIHWYDHIELIFHWAYSKGWMLSKINGETFKMRNIFRLTSLLWSPAGKPGLWHHIWWSLLPPSGPYSPLHKQLRITHTEVTHQTTFNN